MNEAPPNLDSLPRETAITAATALRVSTGARLHFGLLDVVSPFGGVGVMIDQPATVIEVTSCDHYVCEDDSDGRIEAIAHRLMQHLGRCRLPTCRLRVLQRPSAHRGLGSGTQIAMAVAEAICRWECLRIEPVCLARQIADRGKRSAVGVHGYFQGGLIYETGRDGCEVNPVVERIEMPGDWCALLFRPPESTSAVSGQAEQEKFSRLGASDSSKRESLQRMIETELLPAARNADFASFATAVQRYNRRSGELFADVQGGPYNGVAIERLVERLQHRGAVGVGQSSWGPSVFAWFESSEQAAYFTKRFAGEFGDATLTRPLNRGRTLSLDHV